MLCTHMLYEPGPVLDPLLIPLCALRSCLQPKHLLLMHEPLARLHATKSAISHALMQHQCTSPITLCRYVHAHLFLDGKFLEGADLR